MARYTPRERKLDMYKAILQLESLEQCVQFFEDECAMTELQSMEQRFEVAKMLNQNKVYTEIMEKTGASTATISRVKRMMISGHGTLPEILDKMEDEGLLEN